MTKRAGHGLGELLRHLLELTDGDADRRYKALSSNYRPRYTPIMRTLQHGPASVSQLQQQLSVSQGAVSQTIKLMLEDHLIVKERGSDARQSVVSLSPGGRALLENLRPHWDSIFSAIESLEREIQIPLRDCLHKAVHALENKSFAERISDAGNVSPSNPANGMGTTWFEDNGERYARFRPGYPVELVKSLAGLTEGSDLALDVGCGSGQMTAMLAPHFKQVIGTDPSESQISQAETFDNIAYRQQSAEAIDLPDGSVDLVVSAQAAHWFDLKTFYKEARRVAREGAAIALVSYGIPCILASVNSVFQRGYWQDIHEFWPPERAQVETGYADLYFPFSSVSFPQHSYRKTLTLEQFVNYVTTWSAYANACRNGERARFERFFDELRSVWPESEPREVVWPITVKAAALNPAEEPG
jgi:SAM-dependent methyltransferase